MDNFTTRHIGPRDNNVSDMLEKIGADSIGQLIDQTIPTQIRLKSELDEIGRAHV